MQRPATIRDVAREAGVSVTVVSRVLNEGSGPVAAETRARVVAAMEQLRYQPRAAARELQQQSTSSIGLMVPDLSNPFFARLADRVVWEARARRVHVVLLTNQEDPHLEAESIDTLIGRSVGAVIATPTGGNIDKWSRLMDLGVSVIFVDREIDELPDVDVVAIRNDLSAEVTTRHLLGLGHTRIAFITGPLSSSTGRDRITAFRKVMEAARVEVDDRLIHAIPFSGQSGADAVSALLALPSPPTGLIIGNTAQVRNALIRLKQSRTRVPDDLSLIVFDDNPWSELVSPPLSVIRQPIDMLALHSVELALGRVRGILSTEPRRVRVEAEFVNRSSTAPQRSAADLVRTTRLS